MEEKNRIQKQISLSKFPGVDNLNRSDIFKGHRKYFDKIYFYYTFEADE